MLYWERMSFFYMQNKTADLRKKNIQNLLFVAKIEIQHMNDFFILCVEA